MLSTAEILVFHNFCNQSLFGDNIVAHWRLLGWGYKKQDSSSPVSTKEDSLAQYILYQDIKLFSYYVVVHLFPSWLFWAEIKCAVDVALPKRPNQFKPVIQSRQQTFRAYCPNIYAMLSWANICLAFIFRVKMMSNRHWTLGKFSLKIIMEFPDDFFEKVRNQLGGRGHS